MLQDLTFVHIGNQDFLPDDQAEGKSVRLLTKLTRPEKIVLLKKKEGPKSNELSTQ